MSNPPVQAQWSLSQTAGSAVTMTMGVLSALTSDNVQPIAYLACEKFGATLAISDDTLLKIEKSLVPSPPPASLAFLKAQVGFFSDDCATQLGNSQAGVRFLALAAALKSTLELFQAASALRIMLTSSTSDPTLLPTTRHLKDLLSSLEARCHTVGFADDVLGWRVMLQQLLLPAVEFDFRSFQEQQRVKNELLIMGPSPEMVDRLVDVFRQLARVGPSTVTGVTIRLCSAVPWVIAFTKWCLGVPPQISFDGPGSKVILSSHSPVNLRIPRCAREITHYKGLHITIHHEIDHPTMLLAGSGSVIWTGMVPMESYGQLLLQEHNFGGDDQRAMLHEALSCAIPLCLELLSFSNLFQQGESASYPPGRKPIDERLFRYRLSPFHGIRKIAATYAKLFELPRSPDFKETTTTRRVGDCPLVKVWLEDLKARCPCYKCNDQSLALAKGSAPDCGPNYRGPPDHLAICGPCHCEGFYSSLGLIVAEILSLSLFDLSTGGDSSSPLLSVPSRMLPPDIERARLIEKVITSGRPAKMDVSDLLSISRAMVGHYGPTNPNTIMTSNKGQVLFPALFETPHLQRQGFMALSCVPGVLRYDGQEYRNASAQGFPGNLGQQFVADGVPPVLAPTNLFPSLKTYWEITEGDDGLLGCNLGVRSESNPAYPVQVHAMDSLFGLQGCLLLDTCPHKAWETLEEPDRSSRYCKTLRADAGGDNLLHVNVVAIHDAEELLRLASISEHYRSYGEGVYFVLRGNACLSCCLTLCRMTGIYRLIL